MIHVSRNLNYYSQKSIQPIGKSFQWFLAIKRKLKASSITLKLSTNLAVDTINRKKNNTRHNSLNCFLMRSKVARERFPRNSHEQSFNYVHTYTHTRTHTNPGAVNTCCKQFYSYFHTQTYIDNSRSSKHFGYKVT